MRAQQGSEDEHFDYTYDGREDNDNDRTIQKFSTNAATEMQRCVGENDCVFFPDYQLYIDYYQNRAYANKWFTAAFQEENTEFLGGRGDADFNSLESGEAIGEAMKTGALILNIWMAVVRELEVAIDACRRPCDETTTPGEQQCNMDALRAVDSAAAFYVGSLEGRDGGGLGMLLYDLADKTASFFKTKGPLGVSDTGTAYVNLEIIRLLTEAQRLLRGKEADSESTGLCNNVENIKQEIVNLMKVPLVQGTLRAAWNRRVVATNAVDEAQGATFAASLLPYVYNCQKSHALLLHNSLRIGSNATADTFTTVRDALEEIYDCLGVTCDQVGGIWNGESFETGAEPCTEDESRETPSSSSAVHVSLVNTTIYWLGLVLGAFLASTV